MESIYRSPLRVYLALAILSIIGVISATMLPISLFPNSSKPEVTVCMNIDLAPDAFLRQYGSFIEEQYRTISRGPLVVENLTSKYSAREACYDIAFKWGGDPKEALREVQTVTNGLSSRLPERTRDRVNIWTSRENSGFLAISFFSETRSMTELYEVLEPVLTPKLANSPETSDASLYNPQKRQVLVELRPEAMAAFNLFPSDVAAGIVRVFESYNGGSITMNAGQMRVDFPRAVSTFQEMSQIQIPTASGRSVSLGDVARLDLTVPLESARVFKTSGAPTVLLFASPKPGGNVKSMAEGILSVVDESMKTLPKDIQYRTLVDPSEFIRSAVNNVSHEVLLAAGLAVIILFLFVGNIRNVATAAIEIPLSIVLAFILMRLAGMNLNIISLGGLALSAGMNVDASVVVMENIFRHFERVKGQTLTFEQRLKVIGAAVREVQFSVIASTIASLVVFLPLAFTSELSYAILGDLAKAVVFSHGCSAIVALILVPTIRLHLMKNAPQADEHSVLESSLVRLENWYGRALGVFLQRRRLKAGVYLGLAAVLALLVGVVAPRLPREVIGKPDTDWLIMGINTSGNTLNRQMEAMTDEVERNLLNEFGDEIRYTFVQLNRPNSSTIMFRIKDKKKMDTLWKKVEEKFSNTPLVTYWIDSWNPAELPLPNPPDLKVSIRGSDVGKMAEAARDMNNELRERKIFTRVSIEPGVKLEESLRIRPSLERWPLLAQQGMRVSISDLADLTRTATSPRFVTRVDLKDTAKSESSTSEEMDVTLSFPENFVSTPEDLGALPIGVGSRIIPLKALAVVSMEEVRPTIRRENGRDVFTLSATGEKGETEKTKESVKKATELINNWWILVDERAAKKLGSQEGSPGPDVGAASVGASDVKLASTSETEAVKAASAALASSVSALGAAGGSAEVKSSELRSRPTIVIEDAKKELTDALYQLGIAVSLSIVLIFLTMVFQFGSIMNSLLVLVAIPLGFIGVLISLFVFQSTLSLNSLLGVILLNGLSVANSIILVDFLQKKVKEGVEPRRAAVEVATVRLRPILMTSLTTGLGMLPIALGLGEGGKILQPLGIAVAGGLGFSMVMTLFIVPSLQVSWIEWSAKRDAMKNAGASHA